MALEPIKVLVEFPDRQSAFRDEGMFQAALQELLARHAIGPNRKVELVVIRSGVTVAFEGQVVALKAAAD